MHRKTVHRWIAALALVAALGVMGAQPAAAAELSDLGIGDRLASLGAVITAGPLALWDRLMGWFGESRTEKSAATTDDPALNDSSTMGMDPNGIPGGGS